MSFAQSISATPRAAPRSDWHKTTDLVVTYAIPVFYVIFLLFMFTNGKPFETTTQSSAAQIDTGEGDPIRQITYMAVGALSFLSVAFNGLRRNVYPPMIVLLALYAILSADWAFDFGIAFRRAILNVIVIAGACNFCKALGLERSFKLFYYTLAAIMLVSLVSVFVIPDLAKHPVWESDPGLVGAWKGIFTQKNHASAVTAIAIIMFFMRFLSTRGKLDLLFLLTSVVFLIGTRGKTSAAMLVPCLGFGVLCRSLLASVRGKLWLALVLISLVFLAGTGLVVFHTKIESHLDDPTAFTGRVAIWNVALKFVRTHLWLGSGYGAFWNAGPGTPAVKVSAEHWVGTILHSHNGYLEILVFMGLPGLAMAVIGVVVLPVVYLFKMPLRFATPAALFASVWLYSAMHNMLEAYILAKDKQVWTCMLFAIIWMRMLSQADKGKLVAIRHNTMVTRGVAV